MRTLDTPAAARGRWKRFLAQARLAGRLIGMVVGYWTSGAKIRRAYRCAERSGRMFWVDGSGG